MSTQIPGNVGCYYAGCANPVTGQCQGYPGKCGRFCCAQHSTVDTSKGLLCLDCAHRLTVDREEEERKETEKRLFQLYLDAAENVPRTNTFYLMIGWIILSFPAACVISGGDLDNGAAGVIGPMIAGIIIGIYAFWKGQKAKKQIATLTALLPSFDKFYAEWLKHRQAEEQKQALLTLFAAGIAVAATAAARERRISEIEQGVKRALR